MVGRSESSLRRARVLATERTRDLALLQIEGPPLPALALAEPGTAREGQDVVLLGYPIGGVLGFALVTHRGIVSSITSAALPANSASQLDPRAIAQLRQGSFEMLQLDATAYPGSSGGPLLDAATGRVIGVVSMGLLKGARESALSSPTGITYAVPVQFVHELLKQPR
jgi:S1-C subfamily serine protease